MTEREIAALGPAFAAYLRRFRGYFLQKRTAGHFGTYCRGLLSDLLRKTVEPITREAGTAVRTLQEFLVTARWDHGHARDTLPRHLGAVIADLPADPLGTVGVIDETSCRKWGDHTPGVQRQYLGCVGKIDNGIVTVHVGVARGTFRAVLDAELYLPKSWAADRDRCRGAGIPDDVRYRPEWRIAVDQWLRLTEAGVSFDWLVFDAGYGSKVPLLRFLNLAVAFRRSTVEHAFRLGKQEAGLMHYEGRDYTGLARHLTLAVVVLGFVAEHTEQLRGGKPAGDSGAGLPGVEPAVRGGVPPPVGRPRGAAHERGHPLPPAAERAGRQVPQETAA